MRDCAIQAGFETKLIFVDDIGWDEHSRQFMDMEDQPIKNIFKLYPWEWMVTEEFGKNILLDVNRTFWIEPSWKMLLANKAILPILWELYPDHPNLLAAYFDSALLTNYVKKPILGREGANIEIVKEGELLQFTEGEYGKEGYVFQELLELPNFDGKYPMIGSWVVGQEPAGIGIREANSLITDNVSRYVPHLIK
jgi:glutathionylspermidine synthase